MNPLIRISRNSARLLSCAVVLLAFATCASAQSFNIDLDVFFGSPEVGNGAPSSTFGGAANQPGVWNRVDAGNPGPVALSEISGSSTSVTVTATGTGSAGGSGLPINTGDYALLLNDYARIPNQMTYRFTGFAPGAYRVFTYAVAPTFEQRDPVDVTVAGSVQGLETVTGPMPGNSFEYLVTHSIHDIPSLDGDLVVHLSGTWPNAFVNGFQIVSVPEPATVSCLLCFGAMLLRRKR